MGLLNIGTVQDIVLTDSDVNKIYSIKVLIDGSHNHVVEAFPLNTNIKHIPLLGEQVVVITARSPVASGIQKPRRVYYLNPIAVHQNVHTNALIGANDIISKSDGEYESIQAGNPNSISSETSGDLGTGFVENSKVGSLQPYVGDVLLEGRFGHSLRFGYTPLSSDTSKSPSWSSGDPSSPILILSNGRKSGSYNKFIVEDVNDDHSSIWMTSGQTTGIKSSQKVNFKVNTLSYNSPSVIVNSDRLFFNAKDDHIILSAKKDVNISTPNWSAQMDTIFTQIETLSEQVTKLSNMLVKVGTALAASPAAPAAAPITAELPSIILTLAQIKLQLKSMKQ
jgi:hypothetical protein